MFNAYWVVPFFKSHKMLYSSPTTHIRSTQPNAPLLLLHRPSHCFGFAGENRLVRLATAAPSAWLWTKTTTKTESNYLSTPTALGARTLHGSISKLRVCSRRSPCSLNRPARKATTRSWRSYWSRRVTFPPTGIRSSSQSFNTSWSRYGRYRVKWRMMIAPLPWVGGSISFAGVT